MRFEDSISVSERTGAYGLMEGGCSFTFAIGAAFGKQAIEDTLAAVYELFVPG